MNAPKYVVIGIGKNGNYDGQKVFLAVDTSSGGYPWWTNSEDLYDTFDSMESALKAMDINYMYTQASDIQVARLEIIMHPVKSVTPDTSAIVRRINDLNAEIDQYNAGVQRALQDGDMNALERYSNSMRQAVQYLGQAKAQLNAITG